MIKLSIIIPAYNEEKRIENTLTSYIYFFRKNLKKDFEIYVILNGCKDNTLRIVQKLSNKFSEIKYQNFTSPIRKGGAIIEGFKIANGQLIGFVDADMATTPEEFFRLLNQINNYDGIIASRWMKESIVKEKQPILKRIGSRGFNFLTFLLFGLKFKDTQCGAKIFKKSLIKSIINDLIITRWGFDVNLLYVAKRKGYKIKEIPTEWNAIKASHFNLFKAMPEMFLSLIRLRLVYSKLNFIVKLYDKLPESLKIHKRYG